MIDKTFNCAYKYCLHPDQRLTSDNAENINGRFYHQDCANLKKQIQECAEKYIAYTGKDPKDIPMVINIITGLVIKQKVPLKYVENHIENDRKYYKDKPVYVLYGLRRIFWENNRKH